MADESKNATVADPDAPEPMHDEAPARVGRFVVLQTLGSGGMGVVYSAYDEELDRKVAIKILQSHLGVGTQGRARLVREAQALARLSHPNVVQVYEVGEFEDQVYIVMEYIDGEDGRTWGAERHPWQEVVAVYAAAGRGLAAAHRKGLIHRDFKPANFIVSPDGRTRVLDFGLAREAEAPGDVPPQSAPPELESLGNRLSSGSDKLTKTGAVMGTPAYMPPEVMHGKSADERSDQFSFCVALYEAVYGSRPFDEGTVVETMMRTMSGEILPAPPNTPVPPWLRRILARGLRNEPSERFESMDALLEEIASKTGGGRRSLTLLVGGTVAAVAIGGWWGTRQEDATCSGSEAKITGVWNQDVERELSSAFGELDAPFASAAWSTAAVEIDDYAQSWARAHRDNCEATRIRREQSERILDVRAACLAEGRRALAAKLESFREPTSKVAERLLRSVGELPSVANCSDIERLTDSTPAPPAHEVEQVEALRQQVALADALASAARHERADAEFERASELQSALDYQGLVPTYALARGSLLLEMGRGAEGVEVFRKGFFAAVAQDNLHAAAKLATKLVDASTRMSRTDASLEWAEHAESLIVASGDEDLRRLLLGYLARAHDSRGEWDEAEKYGRASLELAREPLDHVLPLAALAQVYRQRGKWTQANDALSQTYEIYLEEWGAEHPDTVTSLANYGFAQLKQGKLTDARETLERAAEQTISVYGPRSERAATVLNNIAGVLEREGRFEQAIGYFQQVYEIRLEVLGEKHPLTAHPVNNLGNAYIGLTDYEKAAEHFGRAREMLIEAHHADHPHVAFPTAGLADVAYAQKRWDDAARHYRRVAEIRVAAKAAPEDIGFARLQIARSLWHLETDRDEALALARSELERLRAVTDTSPDLKLIIEDLEDLLDGNPEPKITKPEL